MKTLAASVSLTATFICLTTFLVAAQNNASRPAFVKGHIERLTLLPGPHLLSPARTTPSMMPTPVRMNAAPPLRFMPDTERFLTGGEGSLRLLQPNTVNPLSRSGDVAPESSRKTVRPTPESLRFDSTLEPPSSSGTIPFKYHPDAKP